MMKSSELVAKVVDIAKALQDPVCHGVFLVRH